QQANQLLECSRIESAVFLQAVLRASAELIEVPSSFRDTDDRNVEVPSFEHGLQRRKDFFVGKIARGAKENERVRVGTGHELSLLYAASDFSAGFSKCPPNSKRIADSSLSA